MSEIQQLIQNIQGFMSGKDRSFQPKVKLMYDRYREQCVELCGYFEVCRRKRENGSAFEARRYSLSMRPPLLERFQILDIPEREEFVALCEDYGLEAMPAWDLETIHWLQTPATDGETTTANLIDYWRSIARKGSTVEKQAVLRQLTKQVADVQWRKNLSEIEHLRYREIENELNEIAGSEQEQSCLEEYLVEFSSSERVTTPPGKLVERIKRQLKPLRQKADERELERLLSEVVKSNEKQDLAGMEKGCLRLDEFLVKSSMKLNASQVQEVEEIKAFIAQARQAEAKEMQYKQLENELRALLEASADFQEVYDKYEEMRRTDHEIPSSLEEQVQSRVDEQELLAHQKHVRHCLYGVVFSLAFIVLMAGVIWLINFLNEVRATRADLRRMLQEEKYEEGIETGKALKKTKPRVYAMPSITACIKELEEARQARDERITSAQDEFKNLMVEVANLLKQGLLEDPEIEKLLVRAEKLRDDLTNEQKKQLNESRGNVAKAREDLRKKRENDFNTKSDEFTGRLIAIQQLLQADQHDFDMARTKAEIKSIDKRFVRLCEESKVDPVMVNKRKDLFAKQLEAVKAAYQEEEQYRVFAKRLSNPSNFDAYLQVISEYKSLPSSLQKQYTQAYLHYMQWLALKEDSNLTGNYLTELDKVETQLKVKGARTPFLVEYSLNGKPTSGILWDKLLANMDKYKYYEVRLQEKDGNACSLYSKQQPVLEWSKEYSGRLRYLYFFTNTNATGKMVMTVLEYEPESNSFALRETPENKAWGVKSKVTIGTPMDIYNLNFDFMPVYTQLEKLKSVPDGEQREAKAWECLNGILASDMSPVLKYHLIKEMLQGFSQWATFYSKELQECLKQLNASPLEKISWQQPDSLAKQASDVDKAKELFVKIKNARYYSKRQFKQQFLEALHRHQLVPVGTLNIFKGKVQFVPFTEYRGKEMIVIENNKLRVLQSDCNGGKLLPADAKLAFNGQLVWGYEDGQTCKDFLSYWRERADKAAIPLKIPTALCPEEYRYFLK